ncbi:MAG: hypothetical protein KDB53_12880 [Planctomycetes bacterium]|nr:hypothetical protein [Planctomycetota bacterium]
MSHPRIVTIFMTLSLLLAGATAQEDERDDQALANETAAEDLLRRVDAGLYYPSVEGLQDLSFRWQLGGTGPFEELSALWLAYFWKSPDKMRMQYVNADGSPLEAFPEFAKTEQGEGLLKYLEQQLHGTAQTLLVGIPLHVIYRDYYKELRTVEVNHKLEHRVIMRPKSKKNFVRIDMKIKGNLPIEFRKTDDQGKEVVTRYRYEARGEKHQVKGMKIERNSQIVTDEEYHYVVEKDLYVLSRIERGIMQGEKRMVTVKLEALRVNTGLKDELFE